ncbi:MAG: hypothetical protein L6R43_19550 [Planctomycetes bacterium]|nr:hypothetical protein [Planctomycetota bacterium]
MIRRLLCRIGIHHWQYLLAPPSWRRGDRYDPGIWCIFCGSRGPRGPGDGARVPSDRPGPAPDAARVLEEVPCG